MNYYLFLIFTLHLYLYLFPMIQENFKPFVLRAKKYQDRQSSEELTSDFLILFLNRNPLISFLTVEVFLFFPKMMKVLIPEKLTVYWGSGGIFVPLVCFLFVWLNVMSLFL